MLRIDLGVADLAATRFATSPLFETAMALRVLRDPGRHRMHLPWVEQAQTELANRPLRAPLTWALLVERRHFPEFFLPAPASPLPAFEEELERMTATSPADVRERLAALAATLPAAARVAADPRRGLSELAAELREIHARLVQPHWEAMRALLDADIVQRARALATGGAIALFADLHPDLGWRGDHLLAVDGPHDPGPARTVILGPDGLVLQPSVFIWPELFIKPRTLTQTAIRYPARGILTLWEAARPPDPALRRLLGAARAELLAQLRAPNTTAQLARRADVTPSAISQHLRVLRGAGLVVTERVGRAALHQLTDVGRELLDRQGTMRG